MPSQIEDEWELRKAAEIYAVGADRRDKLLWAAVLTEDCVIEGPGFRADGRDANLLNLDVLAQMYLKTQHRVHNQIVTIDGDSARGETYSTADHLLEEGGVQQLFCWSIRYQDEWKREDGTWRFSHRRLIVDWEEKHKI